jgi:acyl dehydratase
VYVGDTLFPMLEITGVRPGRTTGVVILRITIHNQDGQLVMDGEHKYLVKRRPV